MPSAFLHPFAPPARDDYIQIVRGEGSTVFDDQGNAYIDAMASLWYCQIGHGRAEMADALAAQVRQLEAYHCFAPFTNEPAERLAAEIVSRSPFPDGRVFFDGSGSESVDSALKLARLTQHLRGAPERQVIVARSQGYHGVTYGGTSAQGLPPNREGWGELLPGMVHVPHHDLGALRSVLDAHAGRVAAVLTEPIQGAGGVHPPQPGYLEAVRGLCDDHGALLIFDEVICGFGRLGTWFAAQHFEVEPDLITFAKGVTSGYVPLGGVLLSRAVCDTLEADPGFMLRHGFTWSGHPLACAAGLANLEIMEREGLVDRARHVGARLHEGLSAVRDAGLVDEVRGAGAVYAVRVPEGQAAGAVRDRMLDHGVIARPLPGNALAFCPPFVITDDEIDRTVGALRASLG
jgi:adenosylmethionine-8-amino-7-oxononanoate aminotransferase